LAVSHDDEVGIDIGGDAHGCVICLDEGDESREANQWHKRVIFLQLMRELKIIIYETPILLLHENSEVGISFLVKLSC
jgi:hypothetical protein